MYCTARDLIAHANRARLVGQLAGNDYASLPRAEAVVAYFDNGTTTPETAADLAALRARVEQAITNATGDIDGYLALVPGVTLPTNTLHAACMDMALFRLFERLDDESVVKLLNDQRVAFFDKIVTGKIPVNSDKNADTGSAETAGEEIFFTKQQFEGY